jgi:hypothetical protein
MITHVSVTRSERNNAMRGLMMMIYAAVLGVAALASAPVLAQGVTIDVPGAGVQVGEPDRRNRDFNRRSRARDDNTGSCKTVTERVQRSDGSVVTRSVRRCD